MFNNVLSRDHCDRNWGHKDERDMMYSQKLTVDWRGEAHIILRGKYPQENTFPHEELWNLRQEEADADRDQERL